LLTPKHVETQCGVATRDDCLWTGPQQQNTDDQNCSDDSAERSTSADWRTADWRPATSAVSMQPFIRSWSDFLPLRRSCSMKTAIGLHQHVEPLELVMQ